MERINALNPSNLISPDDIGFDEKWNKEMVEQYILQQLQLQSQSNGAKYHRIINKEIKNTLHFIQIEKVNQKNMIQWIYYYQKLLLKNTKQI